MARRELAEALAEVVCARRSVRRFHPTPVPSAVVDAALAAACQAPSPHGRQPWRFVLLDTAAARERLAAAMGDEWRRQLMLDGDDPLAVERRLTISRERIRGAPVIIIPCLYLEELDQYPDAARAAAEHTMAVQSLGCAIQNLLLTVVAHGCDAGWMCAPLFCPAVVTATLGLDPAWLPQALIPLGYAAAAPQRRPRRPLTTLVRRIV